MFRKRAIEVYWVATVPLTRVVGRRSDLADVENVMMGTEEDEEGQREKMNAPWRQRSVERGA